MMRSTSALARACRGSWTSRARTSTGVQRDEYLTRNNLMKAFEFPNADTPIKRHKNVAVVGGGNVAMDSVRTALRLGADNAYIVYRRGMEELPARKRGEHAQHEGVQFKILTAPVKVIGNKEGWVCGMECVEMELGEPDARAAAAPSRRRARTS